MKNSLQKRIINVLKDDNCIAVIWGTGGRGNALYKYVKALGYQGKIIAYIDSDVTENGCNKNGLGIHTPEWLFGNNDITTVFVASKSFNDISRTFDDLNIDIDVYDCSEISPTARVLDAFAAYSGKDYCLIDDEMNEEAIVYFQNFGVEIKKVCKLSELYDIEKNSEIAIIISLNHIEIEEELISKGYHYNKNYVVLTELFYENYHYTSMSFVGKVDCGTFGDKNMSNYFCPMPFTQLYYYEDSTGICSPTWNNEVNTGSPKEYSIDEIWNSTVAQSIRSSILDGSFRYCNEDMCWRLLEGKVLKKDEIKEKKWIDIIQKRKTCIEGGPEFLNIGYNSRCNINCKMCRHEIQAECTIESTDFYINRLKEFNFRNLKRLIVPGNGEVFFNEDYMYILEHIDEFQFPCLEAIWIYTNGLLFSEEKWDRISYLGDRYKVKMFVSTDAVLPETYKKIRRGNLSVLLKNMELISEYRKNGFIDELILPFCIQKENFREMTDFVSFANAIGADKVHFEKLFRSEIDECVHRKEHVYFDSFVASLKKAIELGDRLGIAIDYMPFKKLVSI